MAFKLFNTLIEKKKLFFTLKRFIYIGTLGYLIPLFLGYLSDSAFDFQKFYVNPFLGSAMFLLAIIFISFGIYSLTKYGSGTVNPELPPKKLVIRGVYKYIRHPIYFGWILALLAVSLFYRSLSMLIISVLLIPFIYMHAINEEKSLLKRFGRVYADYRKKVPMLIPRFRLK